MPDTHITCSEYHQNFTLMSQLCTRVGRKKIWKKGVFNSGKLHKNRF